MYMTTIKQAIALTSVPQLSLLTMWIQFNAAPKRIEPQNRAWSHLKAFKKIFQMEPSRFCGSICLGAALN